jgi:leucine-rich PPR motif-containing protein
LGLERAAIGHARLGNIGLDDALKLFDELLIHARPASVRALNQLLSVVSCAKCSSSSKLVVSQFNPMFRDFSNKVPPDLCTYSIVFGCFCCMGRLGHGFATFGFILKTGWRVDDILVNQLLKGLCDTKRLDEAMDILLPRMPEVGCTPSVVSYNTLFKGFCDEKRAEEALELLHMMAVGQGSSCPPDVVSYNIVINGFFSEGQVDKAYSLFLEMGVSPNI